MSHLIKMNLVETMKEIDIFIETKLNPIKKSHPHLYHYWLFHLYEKTEALKKSIHKTISQSDFHLIHEIQDIPLQEYEFLRKFMKTLYKDKQE